MGTGFKGHIGCRAPGSLSGAPERFGFRVGAPSRLGPAPTDDSVIPDDDTADRRIGPNIPVTATGKPDCDPHEMFVSQPRRRPQR